MFLTRRNMEFVKISSTETLFPAHRIKHLDSSNCIQITGRTYKYKKSLNKYIHESSKFLSGILHLVCLRSLNISNNLILQLPEQICRLSCLRILNISNTCISTLPTTFHLLKKLKVLNISRNPLEVLPDVLNRLESLLDLDISRCQLVTLPPIIPKLYKLNISGNRIIPVTHGSIKYVIPKWIVTSTHIQCLIVTGRSLWKFPRELEYMKHLQELDLSYTRIGNDKACPSSDSPFKALDSLIYLRKLNLHNNSMKFVYADIHNLTYLTHLDVSNNTLNGVLPNNITKLKYLTYLDISTNKFIFLPNILGNIPNLKHLIAKNCGCKSMSDAIFQLKNLYELDISGNLLNKLCKLEKKSNLRILNVSNNNLKSLPLSLKKLTKLIFLDISYNEGMKTFPLGIYSMSNLKKLYIQNTQIRKIRESIRKIPYIVIRTTKEIERDFDSHLIAKSIIPKISGGFDKYEIQLGPLDEAAQKMVNLKAFKTLCS